MEAPLTSDVVASALDLSDGSFEQKVSKYKELVSLSGGAGFVDISSSHLVLFKPEFDGLNNIDGLVSRLAEEEWHLLLESITHFYFPQLVQAHLLICSSTFNNPWTTFLLLLQSSPVACWDRYARKLVEGALLLESLCESYNRSFPDMSQLHNQAHSQEVEELPEETAAILYFLFAIALHQSLGVRPKRMTSPSALAFLSHRLLPLVSEFRELGDSTLLDPTLGDLRTTCSALADLLIGCPQEYEVDLVQLRWWRCEAGHLGECQKLKEGEEMMACGRCQSVRYSSQDHQRAHWKTHKKACWEPI